MLYMSWTLSWLKNGAVFDSELLIYAAQCTFAKGQGGGL